MASRYDLDKGGKARLLPGMRGPTPDIAVKTSQPSERAVLAEANALLEASDPTAAMDLIQSTFGPLHAPKLAVVYARALLGLGDRAAYEDHLTTTILTFPTHNAAIERLVGSGKGGLPDASQLAACEALAAKPGVGPVFGLRLAALLVIGGEARAAYDRACMALDAMTPEATDIGRKSIASVLSWYGHLDLAERLIFRNRSGDELFDALWDAAILRKDSVYDETTVSYLRFLVGNPNPRRSRAAQVLLDHLWTVEGASDALLDESAAWMRDMDDGARFAAMRAALAFELGRVGQATDLLLDVPGAVACVSLLPVATLVASDKRLGTLAGPGLTEAKANAALRESLEDATTLLENEVAARSVALVGNSGCELGRHRGPDIDRHDLIIRFNNARTGRAFEGDYGARTDVHAMPTAGGNVPVAAGARFALFSTPYTASRNQKWANAHRLIAAGIKVAYLRGDGYSRLARRLEAPPSGGLRVAAWLSGIRGAKLAADDVYGLSLTDQLDARTSAHYFAAARPSLHHNWRKERELMETEFVEAGALGPI